MEDKIKEEGRESKFYGKMTGIAVLFTVAAVLCVCLVSQRWRLPIYQLKQKVF